MVFQWDNLHVFYINIDMQNQLELNQVVSLFKLANDIWLYVNSVWFNI